MDNEELMKQAEEAAETVIREQSEAVARARTTPPHLRLAKWAEGPMADIKDALVVLETVRGARERKAAIERHEAAIAEHNRQVEAVRGAQLGRGGIS